MSLYSVVKAVKALPLVAVFSLSAGMTSVHAADTMADAMAAGAVTGAVNHALGLPANSSSTVVIQQPVPVTTATRTVVVERPVVTRHETRRVVYTKNGKRYYRYTHDHGKHLGHYKHKHRHGKGHAKHHH